MPTACCQNWQVHSTKFLGEVVSSGVAMEKWRAKVILWLAVSLRHIRTHVSTLEHNFYHYSLLAKTRIILGHHCNLTVSANGVCSTR